MPVKVAIEVDAFASGENPAVQARVLSALMKSKRLHMASKEPAFSRGLERLAHFAAETGDYQLTAIAAVSRIGTLVKWVQVDTLQNEHCFFLEDVSKPVTSRA